jgi:tripartite-type tricarboxylate transporter receptor subunit TctC
MRNRVPRNIARIACLLAVLFGPTLTSAYAEADYPSRQITLVVPLPAGGTADILARIAAEQLRNAFGQNVVVENRAGGAGGVIGMETVFKSPPDGYTIVCAPQLTYSIMNVLNPKVSFDLRAFEPVSILAYYPAILLVRGDLPVNNVAELIAYAKANPGKLNYGSQGNGQIGHLAMEQFKQMTGTDFMHVPYRGSAPAITAIAGGQIEVLFDLLPAARQLIEAKKIKMIGVAGTERLKPFPNVQLVSETLPGFEADTWMGIGAPPGTPKAIINKISEAIAKGFSTPAVSGRIAAMDVEPRGSAPEEMRGLVQKSFDRWAPVIRTGKITVE